MCAVSAVSDYYTNIWPRRFPNHPFPFPPVPTPPPLPGIPLPGIPPPAPPDEELRQLLREALERLDKIDKKLGDVECDDEAKRKFLEQVAL